MYARVVMGKIQPGKADEFVSLYQKELLPQIKGDKGFKNVFLFVNKQAARFVSCPIYETEEDVRAAEPAFRERVAKAAGLLAETPAAEIYELSVQG